MQNINVYPRQCNDAVINNINDLYKDKCIEHENLMRNYIFNKVRNTYFTERIMGDNCFVNVYELERLFNDKTNEIMLNNHFIVPFSMMVLKDIKQQKIESKVNRKYKTQTKKKKKNKKHK